MAFSPSEEWLAALTVRAIQRLESGAEPAPLFLSEAKDSFPKLLCLDTNKWIELARAALGRDTGTPQARAALDAVRSAVTHRKLVAPVSGTNATEVMHGLDERRRRELATFMVELSANHSLVNGVEVLTPQLGAAALEVWAGGSHPRSIRRHLVQRGMAAAIAGRRPEIRTGDPTLDQLAEIAVRDPEFSIESLVGGVDLDLLQHFRREDQQTAAFVERVREIDRRLSDEERRSREAFNLLRDGPLRDRLHAWFAKLGANSEPFFTWLHAHPENPVRFTDAVPGIDVPTTLMLERDRNRDHRNHPNDSRDFFFLGVAIPYANVVVTERSWSHLARKTRLDAKYGTRVIASLGDLPAALADEGCV